MFLSGVSMAFSNHFAKVNVIYTPGDWYIGEVFAIEIEIWQI